MSPGHIQPSYADHARSAAERRERFTGTLTEVLAEMSNLAERIFMASSKEEKASFREQMEELEEKEAEVRAILAKTESELNLSRNRNIVDPGNDSHIQFSQQQATQRLLPSNIPKYNNDKLIEDFMGEFETALKIMGAAEEQYVEALKCSLSSQPILRNVVDDLGPVSYPKAKADLIAFIVGPQGSLQRERELEELLPLPKQSVRVFVAEFIHLASHAVENPNSQHVINLLLKKIPIDYQKTLIVEWAKNPEITLKDMALLVNALEVNGMGGMWPVYPRVHSVPTGGHPVTTGKFCSFHQSTSHSNEECIAKPKPSPTSAPLKPPTPPTYHNQSQANSNRTEPNRRAYRVALTENSPGDMPILVNGAQLWGIADFGADISLIAEDAAEIARVSQHEGCLKIQLAIPDHGVTLQRYCEATVQKNKAIHTAKLWIVPDADFQVLLGRDVLPHLGVTISGLSVNFPMTSDSLQLENPKSRIELLELAEVKPDEPDENILKQLQPLIEKNKSLSEDSACTNPMAIVRIPTMAHGPIFKRQPSVPLALRPLVDEKIDELLRKGVIEQVSGNCDYAHPLVIVPKTTVNGMVTAIRMCIDPRLLNPLIIAPPYEIPLIDDIFLEFTDCVIFSTLDLVDGYHQINLEQDHKQLTAFFWKNTRYQYIRCPFGLKHATSEFQRIMRNMLQHIPSVIIYVDDIMIASKTKQDHVDTLKEVLSCLTENNLRVNFTKSKIAVTQCRVLGFHISERGVSPDPARLEAIAEYPKPVLVKDLQRFLGMVNYLRKHTPDLAKTTANLEKERSSIKLYVEWNATLEQEFSDTKTAICNAVTLAHPNLKEEFIVDVDASDNALGVVIFQDHGVIGCYSRVLSNAERKYSTNGKELLAILFGLQKGRHLLLGRKVKLHTDHKPLTCLLSQKHLTPTLAGWIDVLGEFDLEVTYMPGIKNIAADALSRCGTYPVVRSVCMIETIDDLEIRERIQLARKIHESAHLAPKSIVAILKQQGFVWAGMNKDCRKRM